jgi:hypothetical protein
MRESDSNEESKAAEIIYIKDNSSSHTSSEHECELIEEKCNNNDENISKVNNLASSNNQEDLTLNNESANIETNILTNSSKLDFTTSNNGNLQSSPEVVASPTEEANSQTLPTTAVDYVSFENYGKNLNSLTIVSDSNNLTLNRHQANLEPAEITNSKKGGLIEETNSNEKNMNSSPSLSPSSATSLTSHSSSNSPTSVNNDSEIIQHLFNNFNSSNDINPRKDSPGKF